MSRRVASIATLALFLFVAVAHAQPAPSTQNLTACTADSHCASATCCDTTVCVNLQFAPTTNTCKTVPCLQTPGPITTCACVPNGPSSFCQTHVQSVIVAVPATNAPGVEVPPGVPAPVATSPADLLLRCSADSDCGMQTCCESKLCVNTQYAAQCGNLTAQFCPNDQLNCQCMDHRCGRGPTSAPQTTAGSSPSSTDSQIAVNNSNTNGTNAELNNNNSGASMISTFTLMVSAVVAVVLAALQVA